MKISEEDLASGFSFSWDTVLKVLEYALRQVLAENRIKYWIIIDSNYGALEP